MTPELRRRIGFTLGALLVYRLGVHVPLPGLDPALLGPLYRFPSTDVYEMIRVWSRGGIPRFSILSLDILPYLAAAIIIQLVSVVPPVLKWLKRWGEQSVNRCTVYLTLALAAVQAYGIALALESASTLVPNPGWLFRISTVVTLTGGAIFLAWLARQITLRGIGNGIALILLARIVVEVPGRIGDALQLVELRLLSGDFIAVLAVVAVAVTAAIVVMEGARRRLPVAYPPRQAATRAAEPVLSPMSLKLNGAGVIPALIASWLLSLADIEQPWFMVVYLALIVLGTFLYAAWLLGPTEIAADLQKHGGVIPDVEPGERTADYVDRVLTRLTLVGALYLALVCLLPELILAYAAVPFYFGGISLLVVVCTVLDLEMQVRAHVPAALEGLPR